MDNTRDYLFQEVVGVSIPADKCSILPLGEVLDDLIVGPHGTLHGSIFLNWLIFENDYYAKKLLTDESRAEGLNLLLALDRLDYSNADCDWRIWLRNFCLEKMPARIWWAYQQQVAAAKRDRAAASH